MPPRAGCGSRCWASFQTSDLAKVVLVVYVARALAKYREELGDIRVVVRHVLLPVLGDLRPDPLFTNFSTAAVLFRGLLPADVRRRCSGEAPVHLRGTRRCGFALLLVLSKSFPVRPRIDTCDPDRELRVGRPRGELPGGHAKIAIASGGVLPNGPGTAPQRLPAAPLLGYDLRLHRGGVRSAVRWRWPWCCCTGSCSSGPCASPTVARNPSGRWWRWLATLLVLQAPINMAVAVNPGPGDGSAAAAREHGGNPSGSPAWPSASCSV